MRSVEIRAANLINRNFYFGLRPTDNLHLTAPEGNGQPAFHSVESPEPTRGAAFAAPENAKIRSGLCLGRSLCSQDRKSTCGTRETHRRRQVEYHIRRIELMLRTPEQVYEGKDSSGLRESRHFHSNESYE